MVLSLRRLRCILQMGATAANFGALMLTVVLLSRRHYFFSHDSAHSSHSASDISNSMPFDHWSSNRASADGVAMSNANERMTATSSDVGAQCLRLTAGCGPSECGPHGHCVTYKMWFLAMIFGGINIGSSRYGQRYWGGKWCECVSGWTGPDCSQRTCPNSCSGRGVCIAARGVCLCDSQFTGEDCSMKVSELLLTHQKLTIGAPFDSAGRLLESEHIDVYMTQKTERAAQVHFCRAKPCFLSWTTVLEPLMPLLPKEAVPEGQAATCAVVSNSPQLLLGTTSGAGEGADIDQHDYIIRFDNAPTKGYERFVGSRTTHRIVSKDYARYVFSMLGTEHAEDSDGQGDDAINTVVTPATWWHARNYEEAMHIKYVLSAMPRVVNHQLRPPAGNGYAPYTQIFPRVADNYRRLRRTVEAQRLGCYKAKLEEDSDGDWVPLLYSSLFYALQVCEHVDVYGVRTRSSSPNPLPRHLKSSSKTTATSNGGNSSSFQQNNSQTEPDSSGEAASSECCYYAREPGYTPNAMVDSLIREHAFSLLEATNRLKIKS